MLGISRYHRDSNGWNDIGYNFLVDQYGQVFEGRAGGIDQAVIGAQAQGYNSSSTGVATTRDVHTAGRAEAGFDALARLFGWKLSLHGVPTRARSCSTRAAARRTATRRPPVTLERIPGHRDGDATCCPGNALYGQLPGLRLMAAGLPRPAIARVSLAPSKRRITYPEKTERVRLPRRTGWRRTGGSPGRDPDRWPHRAWSALQTIKTDSAGTYRTRVRLAYNRSVRAYFAGEPGAGVTRSIPVDIGVRPQVTAEVGITGGGVSPGDRIAVQGR